MTVVLSLSPTWPGRRARPCSTVQRIACEHSRDARPISTARLGPAPLACEVHQPDRPRRGAISKWPAAVMSRAISPLYRPALPLLTLASTLMTRTWPVPPPEQALPLGAWNLGMGDVTPAGILSKAARRTCSGCRPANRSFPASCCCQSPACHLYAQPQQSHIRGVLRADGGVHPPVRPFTFPHC